MFDPDYDPYGPLSAKDAILAMVEGGETLCDEDGSKHWFNRVRACFDTNSDRELAPDDSNYFHGLRRRPPKSSRDWTRWELLAWVISDESRGWVVNLEDDTEWHSPHFYSYKSDISLFRRARMLPDGAGIDRTTIQGFEKEE
jgi:hypothetical protein